MRIGVNLYPLTLRGGGMSQYVLQLLPWMVRLSRRRFVLFHASHGQPSVAAILRQLTAEERSRVRTVEVVHQDEIFGHAGRFDLYFCPLNNLTPALLDRPTVATLADVQEQFFPHYFNPEQLKLRAELYPRMARAATLLLTISEFSRQSICRAFGVPADKVRVTHLAANEEMRRAAPEWPASLPPLPERFVFYPANLYPHKNHELLLEAIRLLNGRPGGECACVMTGHEVEPGVPIRERIRVHGLEGRASWLGRVSPGALRHLYQKAEALAFPSLFEGFGLPLVEAMQNGCPVVATAAASIPEVVGDAALTAEPTPEAFAAALGRVLGDPALRQELIERGRRRARAFNVRRLARRTLGLLKEAAARFSSPAAARAPREKVTFVVRPSEGGPVLARTLASLSFETGEHDQVLVLGDRSRLGDHTAALWANLPGAGLVPPGPDPAAWLDEARTEVVCFLREGDGLCEGAVRTALAALAGDPDCVAAVGEAIATDGEGKLRGLRYVAPQAGAGWGGAFVPPPVVFWRRRRLSEQRALLGGPRWTNELLAAAGRRVKVVERTFARVDVGAERRGARGEGRGASDSSLAPRPSPLAPLARVAVVVPVRNRVPLTIRFLESFREVDYPNYTVVVVDDGSTDGTAETLARRFPEVVRLAGDGNLWWSRSTNLGVRYALAHGYTHVLTMNNDTRVRPDFLTRLVETSLANPRSVVGCRIHFLHNPEVIWAVGGFTRWAQGVVLQLEGHGGTEEQVLPGRPNPCPVDVLTGCGTLVPAACFRDIGLYDATSCPQYHADSEFVLRARKRGYRALVDLDAVVWNDAAATCTSKNLFRWRSPWYWPALLAIHLRYCPRRHMARCLWRHYAATYRPALRNFLRRKKAAIKQLVLHVGRRAA